jgi:hypothetical protein
MMMSIFDAIYHGLVHAYLLNDVLLLLLHSSSPPVHVLIE